MEMNFEDYPRAGRHNLILTERGHVVFETGDLHNAFWTMAIFKHSFPNEIFTLVVGQPFREDRIFQ